jgi:hypothetical protein
LAFHLKINVNPDTDPADHFDADADPDPAYHADVDPDPTFQFEADPSGSRTQLAGLVTVTHPSN